MNYFYLFIDDDEFTNHINDKIINRYIEKPFYTIFDNARDAMLFLNKFDTTEDMHLVLFLDLEIPDFNGFDTLKLIHDNPLFENLSLSIFILTSHEETFYKKFCEQYSLVKGFVNKPLSEHDLEQVQNIIAA